MGLRDGPLLLRRPCPLDPLEPPTVTLSRLGRPSRGLRNTVSELRRRLPDIGIDAAEVEAWWSWASEERHQWPHLSVDELAALRACSSQDPDLLVPMNEALALALAHAPHDAEILALWEELLVEFVTALEKVGAVPRGKLFHTAFVLQDVWRQDFEGREGEEVCLVGLQAAATEERWLAVHPPSDSCVACVLELDEMASRGATEVSAFGGASDEVLLWPYARGVVRRITSEFHEGFSARVYRVHIEGLRMTEPLPGVLEASTEAVLTGALLLGLNTSLPGKDSALLRVLCGCFEALAIAATSRHTQAIETVWKSFMSCLLEDCHSWKEIQEARSGIVDVALLAARDVAVAAGGLTKRALGFRSCIDRAAMEEERAKLARDHEWRKCEAVAVARECVLALRLETLADPEPFLRFLQLDPSQAFSAAPAAISAFIAAGPAQRVTIFAKLMGLVALAGGLLCGEPAVCAALDAPPCPCEQDPACAAALARQGEESKEASAARAVGLLQLQRMHLARVRLLVAGGAPDVGKTTILRLVFGFEHLAAGLCSTGRTDQTTFELHPEGDERLRPVYIVDTPGYGDGEHAYRNDMGRILVGAGRWLPAGMTLLWVMCAGRNVRQEADELLAGMLAAGAKVIVAVTHVDRFFEDRYREEGPRWRDSELRDVPTKDPRWEERRRAFMAELKGEVDASIASAIGTAQPPQVVYACPGGWMANDEGEEDEFAQPPPWPWVKRELKNFFGILGQRELRDLLDARLGMEQCGLETDGSE